jgi:hypothetical protein
VATRQETQKRRARAQELLGLFAYHRDAPLVARALNVSLDELVRELDAHKIRRRAFSLARGSSQMPKAASLPGPAGPPVRRRKKNLFSAAAGTPTPPRGGVDEQVIELKALLAEVGPRRTSLAERLGGISQATLLARLRAAGLEREFSLRERDQIRALYAHHHGSESRVAAEMGLSVETLRSVIVERGLSAEITRLRDRFRREAREKKWPRERIEQVLHRREQLGELGVLEELEREVAARTRMLWAELRDPEKLRKALKLTRPDAEKLRGLLDLR